MKPKKRSSPHSGSISVRNFGFLVAKLVLLANKLRGQTYFAPFSVRSEEVLPPPKNINAYANDLIIKITANVIAISLCLTFWPSARPLSANGNHIGCNFYDKNVSLLPTIPFDKWFIFLIKAMQACGVVKRYWCTNLVWLDVAHL